MGRFFADTFSWIALLYRRDQWHARVPAFSQTLTDADRLVTTDAVLLEFLAAMSAAGTALRHEAATRQAGIPQRTDAFSASSSDLCGHGRKQLLLPLPAGEGGG